MTEQTDEQIASRVQGGDVDAFGVLMERYEAKLERYARKFLFGRDDVDDLVQEVFIKAFTNIRGFNTALRFSPWIYRIAHNQFLNALRSREHSAVPFFDPDTIFPHPIAPETADSAASNRELRETLDRCLDRLDVKYREPLVLYYFEELDYQEIADILRIPVSTVGVRLARGRAALKKLYGEK
jgi:RNA polymerase sigma-70 factor (ECF subfamily)